MTATELAARLRDRGVLVHALGANLVRMVTHYHITMADVDAAAAAVHRAMTAVGASMQQVTAIELNPPYLIFIGDIPSPAFAKTGFGIVHWRRELCLGQYRLPGAGVDLGLPDLTPSRAAAAGARSMVVGVANVGGFYPASWTDALLEAARAGLDIVAGMHTRLTELPGLAEAAQASGSRLVDVRVPPKGLPVGTGRKRTGLRLLTVGTDCADRQEVHGPRPGTGDAGARLKADFRATGQTGIIIAGGGVPHGRGGGGLHLGRGRVSCRRTTSPTTGT